MGRRPLLIALALALSAAVLTPPSRAQLGPIVEVRNGNYVPQKIEIARGGSMTWLVRETFQHTITEDSCERQTGACLFDHRGPDGQGVRNGETYSFAAPNADVTIGYYCRVHGQPTRVGFPRACG